MRPRTDEDLIAASLAGSTAAAEQLFRRHWPGCWRAAYAVSGRRAAADDIAQDAFQRAFAALAQFDRRRPSRPWLHRIAGNRAVDLFRQERRQIELSEHDGLSENFADELPADPDLARAALLVPERRVVVVLRYVLDYSPPEIAALLDLPEGTVSSRQARALDDLRSHLEVNHART